MLEIVPVTFKVANEFVRMKHRHHKPVTGTKFCVGVARDGEIVGVAMVGRPVARMLQDGRTVEVNRLCTDGTKNACSMLYGAAKRAAKALGYKRLITYTLAREGGASLRASGWTREIDTSGGEWSRPSRQRDMVEDANPKVRWSAF